MQRARWTTEASGPRAAGADGAWPRAVPGAGRLKASGTGPRSPGRPRDAALDTAILQAAVGQLAERGFAGMSMEGVAAAAGTTAPSLRRRFQGKLDLVVAAIDAMRTVPLPDATSDPRADALASLENLQANLGKRNGMVILGTLLAEERRHPELLDRFRQRIDEPAGHRLRQALAQGIRAGRLPPGLDLDAAVTLLIGSLYSRYLRSRLIPDGWAERVLAVIWPPGSAAWLPAPGGGQVPRLCLGEDPGDPDGGPA